mmetsp:Transcript_23097/g.56930  ORF Transcript_23097/g.56930 Transcript_23097/m.56930 type:complete len:966 (-) Transcript_23097:92-2989(-)|eukprot:CAMPEP_0206264772 /NCGR_PEP_ID=MMETSP0047_2-20121206/29604_1 /ASSEMBLY_ACC=CAM_ASM_000192 /TAXON_ID=195065 /ORGANISM="Chroomonas mesostigmatica_cf, Strain CCMP1168" /LENGTH=965 /DNA_ID=CAMNT_0053692551 /DNA_START=74 /DNA_END=2971 /DNA_ORIENTATION=+
MSSLAQKRRALGGQVPSNYVPGLGRGATGFTTRSDIGPARYQPSEEAAAVPVVQPQPQGQAVVPGQPQKNVVSFGQAPAGYVPGAGRGMTGQYGNKVAEEDKGGVQQDLTDSNYSEFFGYQESLFNDSNYDEDDKEADAIWDGVDETMDMRRKERREAREKEELRKYRSKLPTLHAQFADIKRELGDLSKDDWLNIPDANDISHKKRKAPEKERFMPAPDSLLAQAQAEQQTHSELDTRQQTHGGLQSVAGTASQMTDLNKVGEGRNTYLQLKLDRVSDSVSGQTVVDPKGYLTDLNSSIRNQTADVADIKQARLLLKSAITSNPKHAPAWIAAARLEVLAGKVAQARNMIVQGCEAVPLNEDIWVEASSIHPPDAAKKICAQAVHHLPTSVSLWMRASELEQEDKAKRRVLRRALELIPDSERLWKAAVELEEKESARVLLSRAVEDGCCPLSVDLWLALARLEDYSNAKKVLNDARKKVPSEPQIWFTAAKLEEANGNVQNVSKILGKAMREFMDMKLKIADDRDFWHAQAEKAESEGYPGVAEGLVRVSIDVNVIPAERRRIWEAEAEALLDRGAVHCARTVYACLLSHLNTKKKIWMAAAQLEKKHGTPEALDALLKKATTFCPKAWPLWLMGAKEKWVAGDLVGARTILGEAFKINPDNEEIWLAAVKLENENSETQRARTLLEKARVQAGTERIWMQSAILEREAGETAALLVLLQEGLKKYPNFDKMWMMLVQAHRKANNIDKAREAYAEGCVKCPRSINLWLVAVRFEIEAGQVNKARSLLEKARLKNPKSPPLWLETIRLENAQEGGKKLASTRLAQALQECPQSGILWSEAILLEPRQQRRAKSVDAIKNCENDPFVICTVARLFHADRKLEKARTWFNRAVTLNPDFGDAWAYWYKLETQHGTDDTRKAVISRCCEANPKHGEAWQKVVKAEGNKFKDDRQAKLLAVVASIGDR